MLDKATVANELSQIFAEQYARNRTATGSKAHYGFEVVNLSDDLSVFDLVATFKSGQTYCCLEWGCHFPMTADAWKPLRARMSQAGLRSLPPLTIRSLRCVIEQGAIWELEGKPLASESYEYVVGPFVEGENPRQCVCKFLLVEGEADTCPSCERPIP
jgi:hypothetical protein